MSIFTLNIATQREEGWSGADFCHRELFVLFDGFTIPPKPLSSGSMQG